MNNLIKAMGGLSLIFWGLALIEWDITIPQWHIASRVVLGIALVGVLSKLLLGNKK